MESPWLVDGKFKALSNDEVAKLTTEQLAAYHTAKTVSEFEDKIKKAQEKNITKEEYEEFKTATQKTLNDLELTEELKTKIHRKHADLIDELNKMGIEVKKLKESNADMPKAEKKAFAQLSRKEQFSYLLNKALEGEEYKQWAEGDMRGHTTKMDAQKLTGLGSNHTGDIFVTMDAPRVQDIPRVQPHMRDFFTVSQTDETKVTFPKSLLTKIFTLWELKCWLKTLQSLMYLSTQKKKRPLLYV